jgi:hypothetical protein
MYNKLFTRILDSSIWLQPDATRIVWITMLAAMDQDGYARFASIKNLARRAVVSDEAAEIAVTALESPDEDSGNPANDGRRIERVDGGWLVLNAVEHRDTFKHDIERQSNRERQKRFRERRNARNAVMSLSSSSSSSISEADKNLPSVGIARKRAARTPPDDFELTPSLREWAWKNCPTVDIELQTASFKDYTFATAKTDWVKTWRNWMRKANGSEKGRPTRYDQLMGQMKDGNGRSLEPSAASQFLLGGKA